MGILKTITEEYFGETIREEDEINIDGLDVEIVSFTDNNKKYHEKGYKPEDRDNLKELLKRMIEVRGDEGDFNDIDTSDITSMYLLFYKKEKFNGDITGWNVSNVEDMNGMFNGAESFNQPIGKWNISNVEDMSDMFFGAASFNQPIGKWNVSKIRNMCNMFCNATSFNQPISNWDVSKIIYINDIFVNCPIKDEYKPKIE